MTTDKTPSTLAVDVLAVFRRHAESHRASAGSDAYSAQEAPRLEGAVAAVAELIEADVRLDEMVARRNKFPCPGMDEHVEKARVRRSAALARVKGESA